MTAPSPTLDGQYSAFGKVLVGMDAVKRIASARGTPYDKNTTRPEEPQEILGTRVVLASGGGGQ